MAWDLSNYDNWKYDEIPEGVITLDGGTSTAVHTGSWRVQRPVWDSQACKQCMICFMFCPDSSITVEDGKMTGIDLDHCKGCGICAVECPFDTIKMVNEQDAREAK